MCPRCGNKRELSQVLYKPGRGEGIPCCHECADELAKKREYMREWKAKNTEKNREWSKKWRQEHRDEYNVYSNEKAKTQERKDWHNDYRRGRKEIRAEEARKYRETSGDKVREYRRLYYQENNERLREYRKNYIKENPWFNRAASSRKRALIRERMPAWADIEELKMFYKNCPEGMVVDHVVPLKGKNISGLHIASNLQYLAPGDNTKKSNKYDVLSAGLVPVKIWGKGI